MGKWISWIFTVLYALSLIGRWIRGDDISMTLLYIVAVFIMCVITFYIVRFFSSKDEKNKGIENECDI